MECEFGSIGEMRFLPSDQVKVEDSDGNEMFCKCGKRAAIGIISRDFDLNWCWEYYCGSKDKAEFSYLPPDESSHEDLYYTKWVSKELILEAFPEKY